MAITQQAFADAVIAHVNSATALDVGQPHVHRAETEVPDHWVYQAEGRAMSRWLCGAHHGMLDMVYKRNVILPQRWEDFCEQFFSPEARLLMRFYRECQQPSWLTWSPEETVRDDSPMVSNWGENRHQNRTYAALLEQLRHRGLTTEPTRTYARAPGAIGIKLPGRVVDFPGSYDVLQLMVQELKYGEVYQADIPHNIRPYGDSKPVLHMIGDVMDKGDDELCALIARNSHPSPKEQQVVYVLSESRGGELIARWVGQMLISALEIFAGSLVGAIHSDESFLVPNDLSPDEEKAYDCNSHNWRSHCGSMIKGCPVVAGILATIS